VGLRLLDHPHLYYLHESALTGYLIGLLGSWQRARAVLAVLRLQIGCGAAYPSARYLRRETGCSPRTWWRTMEWLRANGLVRTEQLRYPSADYATLIYDLSDLWHVLTGLLLRRATQVAWWGAARRPQVWDAPPAPP